MVKLGWLKSEKFPERDQNIYSIHDACALLVLNQFDITVYYQHFSHIVESDIYWKEIRSTSVINEDFVLRITSFIESFLYIEKSFNFIFLINDYAYKLYYMTSKHYNFYKERCKVYIQQAKSILKQMNAGDFEKCKDSSYLINDEPDTFDSLNYQIEISLDIIMIFLLSTEKSKNSFMKQESLYQELLTKHPLINKEKLVYQFDYINISQELLWLYCDYEQKEKNLTLYPEINGTTRKFFLFSHSKRYCL
ncbi:hypothetical protein [Lactococcus fujiensis]|uniref:hypothetical protein n=1 Tax=Lactococcus fujiensis TaxID=610251 RepID=UPI0006D24EDB|nr:hypothetical protein [Lactococcus fujiensis]